MTVNRHGSGGNNEARLCDVHPENEAVYQCENCLKTLCEQCVSLEAHLYFCRHCGGQARVIPKAAEQVSVKEIATEATGVLGNLVSLATAHIIVPAAIIVMVASFLFFLLDIRSIFLGHSLSLKQVGFFFAMAAVLIARYAKVYGDRSKQMIYTMAMGGATLLAMSHFTYGGVNFIVNLVIIVIVWRFASSVTFNLHLIEEERRKPGRRLYGVERIRHEEVERKHGLKADRYAPPKKPDREKDRSKKKPDAHGNPSAAVARLAVIAIIIFALGEPLLLSAPAEVGERALAAVIIFLLSAGVVLAAGSALGTYRHTLKSGGDASLSMVPLKIFTGLALLIVILAAAITFPGIKYRGSGQFQPARHSAAGTIPGDEDNKSNMSGEDRDSQKAPDRRVSQRGERGKDPKSGREPGGGGSIFSFFAALGKLLLIPLIVLFAGLAIYAVVKLWPYLKNIRWGLKDRLANLLEKLKSLFRRRGKKKKDKASTGPDPLLQLPAIKGLPPREAILLAYSCFLAFLERSGYKRLQRHTPYEYLYLLPRQFDYLSESAGKLTEVYVMTAYSREVPTAIEKEKALAALFKIQHLIERSSGS